MKVYFTTSARGTTEFGKNYERIFKCIKKHGHVHVYDYKTDSDPSNIYTLDHAEAVKFYEDAMKYLRTCDVVILDVSVHSLTMGYIMQKALDMGKPVIALYLKGYVPAFAVGIEDEKLQVIEYTENDIEETCGAAIDYATDQTDTRFNFFISPQIGNYLDWVSKVKRIPRAVYLRRLIEEDMKQNKDYEG